MKTTMRGCFITTRVAKIKKSDNTQYWGNAGNSHITDGWNSTTTSKNGLAVYYMATHILNLWSSNSISRDLTRSIKTYFRKRTCTRHLYIFIYNSHNWEQRRYPSTRERINKRWSSTWRNAAAQREKSTYWQMEPHEWISKAFCQAKEDRH